MIKGGVGGGNTITGLIYEGKVDLSTYLSQQNDYEVKEPVSFEKDSWPTIAANTDSDKYHVGDTKCVTVTGISSTKKLSTKLS